MLVAQIIGGAGTGKTSELLRLMSMVLESKVKDPMRLGFVSFTRAARSEAASRAGDKFSISASALQEKGWFRTIHSVCHRCLGVGDNLLVDNAASRKWIGDALGGEASAAIRNLDGDLSDTFSVATDVGKALNVWDVARNRLRPLRETWEGFHSVSPMMIPDYHNVEDIVREYEKAKDADGKLDFTDMLLRVAGIRHRFDDIEEVEVDGELPNLPCWFFDEQQDTSALSDRVCRRLIIGSSWVYVVGDPFQSIYGWAGADPRYFLGWPVEDQYRRILDKSFRCPSNILEAGESILRPCTDYFDRNIKPNEDGGIIDSESFLGGWESRIDPSEDWLLLARTNRMAYRMSQILDDAGIPWGPTQSNGNRSIAKSKAVAALYSLETGSVIDGEEWASVIDHIPSTCDGVTLLERGTKKRFQDKSKRAQIEFCQLRDTVHYGATLELIETIGNGRWRAFMPEAEHVIRGVDRWGVSAVLSPRVRVGTIHSAKGAEADHVAVLTSITSPIERQIEDQQGENEERRVWYVAATRARKSLTWLHDYRDRGRVDWV